MNTIIKRTFRIFTRENQIMRSLLTFIAFIFLFHTGAFSLDKVNERLLKHAKACPAASATSIKSLVAYLKTGANGEKQLVEVFCYWIAENIAYDTKAYISGQDCETATILKTRKGVCQNYSELLQQMCNIAGLECHVILGYSKGFGYKKGTVLRATDHAWNVIRVDGLYTLTDVTWASGFTERKEGTLTFIKELKIKYILANPDYFVLKHLPGDPRWQMRSHPVTIAGFGKDSLRDMATEKALYNYADSVKSFVQADSVQRRIMTAESTWRFNPTNENLKEVANAYYHKAWYTSNYFQDKDHYELAIVWYNNAKKHFITLNNAYGQKWITSCDKGIAYCEYYLKHPQSPK